MTRRNLPTNLAAGGPVITTRDQGPVHILHVTGEIDLSNADQWYHCLVAELADTPRTATALVVDLTGVNLISAAGVRAFAAGLAAVPGAIVPVVVARGLVLRAIELTDLTTLLRLERELDTVLETYRLADDLHQLRQRVVHYERRLEAQPVIEQAKGMLIQTFGVDDRTAFDLLARLSRSSNQDLRELARSVVDDFASANGEGPRPDPPDLLATLRDRLNP